MPWGAPGVEPSWNVPGSRPEWRECVLDRANSMFQRDKNHVSVLFWSCGNESFGGQDILDMANFFRTQDPGRVVHYEGCYWCKEWGGCSDVESRMYATPTEVREYLENDPQKPFLLCEYMHDMGNSLGGMESYIRLGEEFPMYQGGFIWDYMDQALWQKNALGSESLATAATLRSARATTASAATALSPPTAGRSPACRKCATGTCQRSSGTPGTRPMHKLWQPSGLCPPPATPRTSSSPKATEPGA